jgi:hypothetical protein
MESLVLPEIKLKTKMLSSVTYDTILAKVVEKLKQLPNISQYKGSLDFLRLACSMIEQLVKKKHKIDKKKLVLDIMHQVFGLLNTELLTIGEQIEFLLQNKMIKSKSLVKKVVQTVTKHVFQKK